MDGILVLNKEKGFTSHDMIKMVRKKLNMKKVGHTGTLDPMATGVLVICLGRATKISDYIMRSKKTYLAKIRLGILTDSFDIMGNILKEESFTINKDKLLCCLNEFVGKSYQLPPMYSAIKVNGKKLYEYARLGLEIDRKERLIEIYSIELIDFNNKDEFTIRCKVSSGTYIRSLANDIGKKLNTFGTLLELAREENSTFTLDDCICSKDFIEMPLEIIKERIISMEDALLDLEKFTYPDDFYDKLINGVKFELIKPMDEKIYRLYCRNEFIGLGRVKTLMDKNYMTLFKKLIG